MSSQSHSGKHTVTTSVLAGRIPMVKAGWRAMSPLEMGELP